jgi:hypothetical protein
MFSELIVNGQIGDLSIGKNILNSELNLEKITEEEGDIPSLYNLNFEGEDFQITTLKGKVIGILYDFEYEKNRVFNFGINNEELKIGYTSNFKEFSIIVERNKIQHKKAYSKNNDCAEIQIEKSGISLRFVNVNYSNLCKIWNFDRELYETLCNEVY